MVRLKLKISAILIPAPPLGSYFTKMLCFSLGRKSVKRKRFHTVYLKNGISINVCGDVIWLMTSCELFSVWKETAFSGPNLPSLNDREVRSANGYRDFGGRNYLLSNLPSGPEGMEFLIRSSQVGRQSL